MKEFLNWLWPMCPTGLPHRMRGRLVRNMLGHTFCWHPQCMRANVRECDKADEERGLRERFAAAALNALIIHPATVTPQCPLSMRAHEIADAMLAASTSSAGSEG